MDSKKIVALVLIGLLAVVLIVNRGLLDRVTLDLVVTSVRASISMILLGATALGVTIGILIK
jgi:hypothetical protein